MEMNEGIKDYNQFKSELEARKDISQSPLEWAALNHHRMKDKPTGEWLLRWAEEQRQKRLSRR